MLQRRFQSQRGTVCTACLALVLFVSAASTAECAAVYRPLALPLEITVNQKGEISFATVSPQIPTPIGTFSVYSNVAFPQYKTLTIILGTTRHVYDMGNNNFEVKIPNDRKGQSKIIYEGGNIIVVIPDPVFKTQK